MAKKLFSLQRRKTSTGKTIYYVQFKDPDTGKYLTAKSTGESSKGAAETWSIRYIQSGQIVTRENVSFTRFAEGFFDYDTSDWVRAQLLRGRQLGRTHVANLASYLKNYLLPFFGPTKLQRIDTALLEEFRSYLVDRGLSSITINHIFSSLNIIMEWALKKKCVQKVPTCERLIEKKNERGVLTPVEVKKLFSLEWSDPRHYAINLLAITTGARLGECLALPRRCVHPEGYIDIMYSWERGQGLKGTKTGRVRYVPIPKRTQEAIQAVMDASPWKEPDDLVFYTEEAGKVIDHKMVDIIFYRHLEKIGIDAAARKARGIVFHSHRHFFNSLLINGRIPTPKVQSLTGHSTMAMTENYFHPDEYLDVLELTESIA